MIKVRVNGTEESHRYVLRLETFETWLRSRGRVAKKPGTTLPETSQKRDNFWKRFPRTRFATLTRHVAARKFAFTSKNIERPTRAFRKVFPRTRHLQIARRLNSTSQRMVNKRINNAIRANDECDVVRMSVA